MSTQATGIKPLVCRVGEARKGDEAYSCAVIDPLAFPYACIQEQGSKRYVPYSLLVFKEKGRSIS